jgi:hypothetical protein
LILQNQFKLLSLKGTMSGKTILSGCGYDAGGEFSVTILMRQRPTRRALLGGAGLALAAASCSSSLKEPDSAASEENGIPLVDFHAHPGHDITLDDQIRMATERGVKLGVLEHAGKRTGANSEILSTDDDLLRWIGALETFPVYKGIQAEGGDWPECFSKEVVAQLDFSLADALTLPEADGSVTELWRPGVMIGDRQKWMDRYTDFNVTVIAGQPIDIMANPLFLPEPIRNDSDSLWTDVRMRRIVEAAVRYNVAIEINSRYRIPGERFLSMARDAGVRFSYGSNEHGRGVAVLDYCIEMAKRLGLTREHMFSPASPGGKPIEVREFG